MDTLRLAFSSGPAALARLRRRLSDWSRAAGLTAEAAADLVIATGEAIGLVSRGPHPLVVEGRLVDRFVRVRVHDGPASAGTSGAPLHMSGPFGAHLMRSLADESRYESMPDGSTVITLKKQLPSA